MSVRYCCYHGRRHSSAQWYTAQGPRPECHWCSVTYVRLLRLGGPRHPLWLHVHEHVSDVDTTGRPIAVLSARADVAALVAAEAILRSSAAWSSIADRVFALGYLHQANWPEPTMLLVSHFIVRSPGDICRPENDQ